MKLLRTLLAFGMLSACADAALAKDVIGAETFSVPFSDPSRPGTVHISIVMGSISVVGRDIKEVVIEVNGGSDRYGRDRDDRGFPDEAQGLRRILPAQPDIKAEEHNNRIE